MDIARTLLLVGATIPLQLACVGSSQPEENEAVDAGTSGEHHQTYDETNGGHSFWPPIGPPMGTLAYHRNRLFTEYAGAENACGGWNELDTSQRAVFLTLTDRLAKSQTADGQSMLGHIDSLRGIAGGGEGGDDCGGIDNNRAYLSMDSYLFNELAQAYEDENVITDGGDSFWGRSGDPAGPHAPFDRSIETSTGLECFLLIERSGSKPPTGQAQFFSGEPSPIDRGSIQLEADPYMLELDHDYDCQHKSNPTCSDFSDRYLANYGDFECDWVPTGCTAVGTHCYRGVQ